MSALEDLGEIHEALPRWIEEDLALRGLSWREVERGDVWKSKVLPFESLEEFQQWLIFSDPVHFGECFLREADVPGYPPWRFFDYQKPSLRFRGNKIHQDGAEVGKTREIVCLTFHRLIWLTGGQLVGAALDGHLEEIHEEMQAQFDLNHVLGDMVASTRIKPYRSLRFKNGNTVKFRPAGSDGSAFRGVHVSAGAYLDEAAKVGRRSGRDRPSPEAMDNFFRACKPGCQISLYSVPDGRRDTRYYEICEAAPEVDVFDPPDVNPDADPDAPRIFYRFRWPKTLMPTPFWSEARRQEYEEQYGGRRSAGYLQNVLGEHGEPTTSVFPWFRLRPCVHYLDGYVRVKLSQIEEGRFGVEEARLTPDYVLSDRLGADDNTGQQAIEQTYSGEALLDLDSEGGQSSFEQRVGEWKSLLEAHFGPLASGDSMVAGVDFGRVNDPTEILFGRLKPRGVSLCGRLQLLGVNWDEQAEIIQGLDAIVMPSYGWGFEATGVGNVVGQLLSKRIFEGKRVQFTNYVMNSKCVARDPETGAETLDENKKPKKVSYKHLGTTLLVLAMQRQQLAMPYDPDILHQFPNHSGWETASGEMRYAKTHDDLIEAARVLMLRKMSVDLGDIAEVPIEFATTGVSRSPELFGDRAHPSGRRLPGLGFGSGLSGRGGMRDLFS